jgi:hypothetical protein
MLELLYLFTNPIEPSGVAHNVSSKAVGISLFGPYLLAVEIASMLLLAGLIGAYHLGRHFFATQRSSPSSRPSVLQPSVSQPSVSQPSVSQLKLSKPPSS